MRGEGAAKSATAFRTISEVSGDLEVPQHVLRFWETKFPQIRPLKRGGGRRYYRPEDVALLRRIQSLLYKEGYTIKGVQRLLRESRGALPPLPDSGGEGLPPPPPAPDEGAPDDTDGPDEPPPPTMTEEVRETLEDLLDELRALHALLTGKKEDD